MQELELGSRNYHYVLVVLHLFGDPLFVDADTHTHTVTVSVLSTEKPERKADDSDKHT